MVTMKFELHLVEYGMQQGFKPLGFPRHIWEKNSEKDRYVGKWEYQNELKETERVTHKFEKALKYRCNIWDFDVDDT